jgi:site-specific recombinase XerD
MKSHRPRRWCGPARIAAGSDPCTWRAHQPPLHRILYRQHPQSQYPTSYARAVKQFFDWCDAHHLDLNDIEPISISAYIELLGTEMAKPSVKQHLAAIRQLFDYLVTGGILPSNPAGSVRGPKYVTTRGKTPVLSGDEMRQLLESIDTSDLIGLRDRALIGVMGYTFARVSAVARCASRTAFNRGAVRGCGCMRKAASGMRCPATTASTTI